MTISFAKPTAPRDAAILDDHRAGMIRADIARKYGISAEVVRVALWRAEEAEQHRQHYQHAMATVGRIEDFPVDALRLSVRAANCLRYENIKTVGQAMRISDAELCRVPNFGRVSLGELRTCIATLKHDMGIEDEPEPPEPATTREEIAALKTEVAALREDVAKLKLAMWGTNAE